jgi:hypothetical protein
MRNQLAMTVGLGLVGLWAASAQGPLYDKVIVDLPYPVTIQGKTLEPGQYEIREMQSAAKSRILQIFRNGQTFETSAMTIPALDNRTPEDTRVILHKLGNNQYYFDKIWIQGKDYGYEFVLPEDVRNRQQEMKSSTVAGRWESGTTTGRTTLASSTAANRTTPSSTTATAESTTTSRRTTGDIDATANTTTGRRTPNSEASLSQQNRTTFDSDTNQNTATGRTTPRTTTGSSTLTAQNRQTDPTSGRSTPRSTTSGRGTPGMQAQTVNPDQTTGSRTTPRGTPGMAAQTTGADQTTGSRATPRTTTGQGGTLPATSGNWLGLLLYGSALGSLGAAALRRVR